MNSPKDDLSQLRQQKDIKRAIAQSVPAPDRTQAARRKTTILLSAYLLLLLALSVFYYLLRSGVLTFEHTGLAQHILMVQRLTGGAMAFVTLLLISRLSEIFLIGQIDDVATRYNIRRLARLLTGLTLTLIAVEALIANWTTAVVSLGLITLILGFALQTPITSFIGWIYILVRAPYRIGDRIRIGEVAGDVIDVGYLDTTLWEYGGTHVGADDPSGRIIKFPNSNVLSSSICNYSWPLFPYVWNQVKVSVGYQSDLKFVTQVLTDAAAAEGAKDAVDKLPLLRDLLAETHVNQSDLNERPSVSFAANDNTWIEASVRYLVMPRDASDVSTRVLERILTALNAAPERAMVPQGDGR
jgi:small-conductance mechanosensitive channel